MTLTEALALAKAGHRVYATITDETGTVTGESRLHNEHTVAYWERSGNTHGSYRVGANTVPIFRAGQA